jgi:hypothetical protein
MKLNKYLIGFIIILVLVLFFLFIFKQKDTNNKNKISDQNEYESQDVGDSEIAEKMKEMKPTEDTTQIEVKGVDMGIMMMNEYELKASLHDVTGGNATGIANSTFKDGSYSLYASFANLKEPNNDDFYEGWLVRKDPFDFISTGKVEKLGGMYTNIYSSQKDLSKYNLYVLTLEPNDGNPAPAKHIVEGVLK